MEPARTGHGRAPSIAAGQALSDRSVPDARFETYRREFGDKFEAIELEDANAAPAALPPHSVLTIHMREDGPTKAAEQRVIACCVVEIVDRRSKPRIAGK